MAQELPRRGRNFPVLGLTSVVSASGLAFGRDVKMEPADLLREAARPLDGED